MRLSLNPNQYVSSRKVFMNLRNQTQHVEGQYRNFSKPDYLKIYQRSSLEGNRAVVSKFTGWVTVDENSNLTRKTAPEVAKCPLTEA